jgi:hypothetical protein
MSIVVQCSSNDLVDSWKRSKGVHAATLLSPIDRLAIIQSVANVPLELVRFLDGVEASETSFYATASALRNLIDATDGSLKRHFS